MKQFEFLPHTADVKFLAYGEGLAEAFGNAALATTAIMTHDKVKPKKEKKITIKENKLEALLYDFLEELVFLVDTEGFLVGEIELDIDEKDDMFILEATLQGDSADNYEITTHIKSVTYNDMFIKEEENKVTIQVVHDI